jgi:EAL domain-containing protein (putative c-di-GMP-specific phosphodiesterase class I)
MSLYRQLWIAISVLMLLIFGTTFLINGFSSSAYLEQQLTLKNQDDATALALSLSQQTLDPVALEIQLATQLDLGSYASVRFQNADGSQLFDRSKTFDSDTAPSWIKTLFSIDAAPGSAQVTSGWTQLGTLTLKSHDDFAYAELWASAQRTLLALVLAILAAGLVGTLLLRLILKPLDQVVAQASALGERRFTTVREPATLEFARVTRAMNSLTQRVQAMLAQDAERLQVQRNVDTLDALTGLPQRGPFIERLSLCLQSDTGDADGALALVRINRLAELNQMYGRKTMDSLIRDIGANLSALGESKPDLSIAHMNASDFIVLAPGNDQPEALGALFANAIRESLVRHDLQDAVYLPTACTRYQTGDSASQLMSELDEALMLSASTEGVPVTLALEGNTRQATLRERTQEWESALRSALSDDTLQMALSPVVSPQGDLLHHDAQLQLPMHGKTVPANEFMPWAHRVDLEGELDRRAVSLGLALAAASSAPVNISLSFAAIADEAFVHWLDEQLKAHSHAASQLRAGVNEAAAFTDPQGFEQLQNCLKKHGGQLGIQQVGHRVSDVGLLGELGADYLRIAPVFVQGIDENEGKRALLQIYVNIARALGVPCIADGVSHAAERDAVLLSGANGIAGPAISAG